MSDEEDEEDQEVKIKKADDHKLDRFNNTNTYGGNNSLHSKI